MRQAGVRRRSGWVGAALLGALVESGRACATCFGQSDSDLARGMNMGILALLIVVAVVLSGITAFFLFLARKSTEQLPGSGRTEWKRSEP